MTDILDKEETETINHNGVSRITIPDKWAKILNLEAGQTCERAIVNGKHGLFLAVWSTEQPNLQEIDEGEL